MMRRPESIERTVENGLRALGIKPVSATESPVTPVGR
jgi:hypothetical protein